MAEGRLIDLSHRIDEGMTTYPGLPEPEFRHVLEREASRSHYADGVEFRIDEMTLGANTGTYVDSPYHRWADGADLAALPLERLVDVPAVVVDAVGRRAVDADALDGLELADRAVLVHTGHDRHWRTPGYAIDAPFLTRAAVERLVAAGAAVVGIDSINIDDRGDLTRPAHSLLLRAGIPIVENLTHLDEVPRTGARFTALPPAIRDFVGFPVRAIAQIPG
jgi:kynurenine formamidase